MDRLTLNELSDLPAVVDAAGLLELLNVYGFLVARVGHPDAAATLAGHYFVATRGAEAKRCKVCGRPFTAYPGRKGESGVTVRREFCSAACRMRDYRDRKSTGP